MNFLYTRVWLSYKSTLLGLLVAGLGEAIAYAASGSSASIPPWVHILAGLLLTPFLAWKDKAVKDGEIVNLQPRGFLSIRLAVIILVGCTVVLGIAGCASFKSYAGAAEIDCATTFKAAEIAEKTSLEQGVVQILMAGGQNWEKVGLTQLDDLVQNSKPLALCVIASVEANFRAQHQQRAQAAALICTVPGTASPLMAAERAHFYLSGKPALLNSP